MYEQWVVSGNNKCGKIWNWIPYFSIYLMHDYPNRRKQTNRFKH
jgi:hypothetical protein